MPHRQRSSIPLLIAFSSLAEVPLAEPMCAPASLFAKAHTWDDSDGDGRTSAGDTLHYSLLFCEPGAGNRRCAFEDTVPAGLSLSPASVVCLPNPGTTPPVICGESPAGSGIIVVDYATSRMDRNACVLVTFDATVVTAPVDEVCNQAVNRVDRSDVSDNDCQQLVPQPDLEIAKTARAAFVQADGQAVFDIVVGNTSPQPFSGGSLFDLLDPCFAPLGTDGAPCDAGLVTCAGPGCAGTTCRYAAGGLGFTLDGFSLGPHDVRPGGPDEIAVTVTATAGPTDGTCANTAETSDPDSASLVARATVTIRSLPDLEITKTALAPSVEPGLPAAFDIVIHNQGAAALAAGSLFDILDPCFQPLGVAGAPCDPLAVACAGVGCAGATCTYSNGGLGFGLLGFTLARNDGAAGGDDEITVHVVAAAGPAELPACRNRAETSDPDSPLLQADASVQIAVPRPDLEITKTTRRTLVAPGAPVDFDIVLHNLGSGPLASGSVVDLLQPCFLPLGVDGAPCDTIVVACSGAGCAGSTCVYSGGGQGFTLTGFALAADDGAPGGPDEVGLRVTAVAGPVTGPCTNQAETSDPSSPSLIALATVDIDVRPDLEISKIASSPSVLSGASVDFAITVHNIGTAPLSGGNLIDTLDPCFLPLGPIGNPCDAAVVSCAGPGCATVTCVYAGGGLGFNLSGFTLDPDDGVSGGRDQIVVTVVATAGPTPGPCTNLARTSDPDSAALVATASVDIVTSARCDLMDGDLTFPPRAPDPATLYARACPPGDARLSRRNTPAAARGDLPPDVFAGAPGTMRLYQLDCPCAEVISLTKNTTTGKVRLGY